MADGSFDLGADVVELAPYVPPPSTGAPLREVSFRADGWTADEIDLLRSMFAADEAMADIAAAVGHTFHATRTKVCDLGLRRNSARPFTDLDDSEIVRRYGEVPTATLAQDLGRSCSSIYQRAAILGLTDERPPAYTAWEDAQLRAGYASGVPVAQIAALIGRTMLSVRSRAFDALRLQHKNHPVGWTEAECTRALELAQTGMLYREIRAVLLSEGFTERSQTAFKIMMQKLAYGRGWGRRWSAEEDELLRRAYAEGSSLTPLAIRLGRGKSSIQWRAGEMGLQGTHVKKAGWLTEPVWDAEEDALLRANYGKVRGKKLGALFERRGLMAVYQRANALGLSAEYNKPVTEDELRAIQIAYLVSIGFTDLGLALERDTATVHRLAKVMGLHFSDPSRPKVSKRPRALRPPAPSLAEILAMAPADMPPGPFLPLLGGWRKRGRPKKETADVA